jgi:hypothetical protein
VSTKERLLNEISQAPDFLLEEVLTFFLFLKQRLSERNSEHQAISAPLNPKTPNFLLKAREIGQALSSSQADGLLPTDFAKNLDHYLYGAPKIEE